ncbi:lambda exonuclease family protein [Sphingomonas paucimobilis]|uniref:lambda exonuclease family protein n=1 Tax=Sphingomonas paucimobilis TaxID=13689 RepID=UPI002430A1C2|nr:lambda exonuclease family protein [Sphingomonas paucimobilis]
MDGNPFDRDYRDTAEEVEAPRAAPKPKSGGITYHANLIQGSDEWLQQRCGLMTASEMKLVLTPKLKIADNDKVRAHVFELAAQRLLGHVEPHYVSDDMIRGHDDEIEARELYGKHYAPVREVGFITNDKWGFKLGYSPDALVGDDGLIECKSRRQKYQVQTIARDEVPEEYVLQLQTGLLVSEREWIDFVSYSGGQPLYVKRVLPDPEMQAAIIEAAGLFEQRVAACIQDYRATLAAMPVLIPTERRVEEEMRI